jgi:alpha-N-acetylglucosaminidase
MAALIEYDYAFKEWSDLLRDFYLVRWEMFIREMQGRLRGKGAAEINYFEFEKNWTLQRNAYPVVPSGDPVETATHTFSRISRTLRQER